MNQPNVLKPHWNTICNQFFNGWKVIETKTYHWTNYCQSWLDNFCQHIAWHELSKFTHQGEIFLANIGRDEFWDTCAHFVHMVEPTLMSLNAFNGKQPCMKRAWFLMKTLTWHVLLVQDPSFELPLDLVDVIKNQFYQRWKMLTINLHYARALLIP
jgi:hypothetical protein